MWEEGRDGGKKERNARSRFLYEKEIHLMGRDVFVSRPGGGMSDKMQVDNHYCTAQSFVLGYVYW